MTNPNVLSLRYATDSMNNLFSEKNKVLLERDFWIAVMKAQKDLGVDIPSANIEQFEKAKEDINLERIKEIEKVTKHDIKAKIEAFVEAAGSKSYVHMGLTSRDLSDNVEQYQFRVAANMILGKYVSVLRHFMDKADDYQDILLTARTHHQAAQPTVLGHRFSMWAEELWLQLKSFDDYVAHYPLRSIKGAVGTQSDMLKLLGDKEKVRKLEERVAEHFGFKDILHSTGQVYPRSLDYEMLSKLSLLGSACENFAKGMRLMAGYELVTEGFSDGQVGSSAMPHKMNTRSSERICGFNKLLKMYVDGASRLSGNQWEEGDVSCSVVRRVIMPDAFYTSDGLCETTLTVLNNMGVYPTMIDKEVDRFLPFTASSQILMSAIQAGIGREHAHERIKQYAVQEALRMRDGHDPNLPHLISSDPLFANVGITEEKIYDILQQRQDLIGLAKQHIHDVRKKGSRILGLHFNDTKYEPGDIL